MLKIEIYKNKVVKLMEKGIQNVNERRNVMISTADNLQLQM